MPARLSALLLSSMLAVLLHATATPPPDARATQQAAGDRTGDVIVRFHAGTSLADVGQALAASDTAAVKTGSPSIAAVRPEAGQSVDAAVDALNAHPGVDYAEPDLRVTVAATPNDAQYGSQWHYPNANLPGAWDVTTGSSSVIVAVVDTGVQLNHPELDSKITSGANAGYDFFNGDTSPNDDSGHGTHVAGTIGAETNNSTGVAGVCWACKIMPVKVLDAAGNGSVLDVAAGIDWARTHGAHVINVSLGTAGNSITLQNAVDAAWNAGVIVVGAAGNYADDGDTTNDAVLYPAAYANAIAVGAHGSSGLRASFSNYGSALDLTAPGVDVLSTIPPNTYDAWSGTSMATPHVAGIVGLMISHGITDKTTIRNRLTSTATDAGAAGFDNFYGHGRVNAHAALTGGADTTPPTVAITSPGNGATVSGTVNITASASDAGAGVEKVRFWVDNSYLSFDAAAPYSKTWNTTSFSNGTHTLKAQAVDNNDNASAIISITVTVSNSDATPPAVSITSPSNGATVSGTLNITASASDTGSGVQKVRFWVDNSYLSFDASLPYSKAWNTTSFSNGTHTLKAQAVDNNGNASPVVSITVTVGNNDTTPPEVSITSPADGATVSGTVNITATASDTGAGVQKVRFWVDNLYLSFDASSPYSKTWDTTTFLDGVHTIKAEAVDNAGNVSLLAMIAVTVDN